ALTGGRVPRGLAGDVLLVALQERDELLLGAALARGGQHPAAEREPGRLEERAPVQRRSVGRRLAGFRWRGKLALQGTLVLRRLLAFLEPSPVATVFVHALSCPRALSVPSVVRQ